MDPKENQTGVSFIEDQVDLTVIEYVLREGEATEHKAKKCGCRTCVSQRSDAEDRQAWLMGWGKWLDRKVGQVTKGGKRLDVYKSGRLQSE